MEIELGQALGNIETWDFSPGFVLKLIVKFNQKFNEVWVLITHDAWTYILTGMKASSK